MKSIILTANWKSTDRDDYIKEELNKIAYKHRVNTDVHINMKYYIEGCESHSAEIYGWTLYWKGKDKCTYILNRLEDKWRIKLKAENIDVTTTIHRF
jgi:hypothetical protein